jgi:hypothetical protein
MWSRSCGSQTGLEEHSASGCETQRVNGEDNALRTVVKWKWSLSRRRCTPGFSWSTTHLGVDDHGVWLGARRGNPVLRPDGGIEHQAEDAVWLIPSQGWWMAAFWFTATTDLTIDICQPPRRDGDTWSFVDLELDLYRNAEGEVGIVDQDEFAALAAAKLVAESDLSAAEDAADHLLPLVQQQAEPFGLAAKPWLGRVRLAQ